MSAWINLTAKTLKSVSWRHWGSLARRTRSLLKFQYWSAGGNVSFVGNVSVYSACTLVPSEKGKEHGRLHVLWSWVGLQNKAGSKGQLLSTLGMFECANYQSNLDGKPLTIGQKLKECSAASRAPSKLTFLQLYTHSAHTHGPAIQACSQWRYSHMWTDASQLAEGQPCQDSCIYGSHGGKHSLRK